MNTMTYKPYSGKLLLRLPSDVHAAIATTAEVSGKSIKQWATEVLAKAVQGSCFLPPSSERCRSSNTPSSQRGSSSGTDDKSRSV